MQTSIDANAVRTNHLHDAAGNDEHNYVCKNFAVEKALLNVTHRLREQIPCQDRRFKVLCANRSPSDINRAKRELDPVADVAWANYLSGQTNDRAKREHDPVADVGSLDPLRLRGRRSP